MGPRPVISIRRWVTPRDSPCESAKHVLTASHHVTSHADQVEIGPGEPATITSLPAPTSSSTAVPGLSSSQAQWLASKLKGHSNKGKKIAAIVGGTLCGIALVAASVGLWLWRARIKRRRTTRAAAAVIFANRAMPMQEKVSGPREEPVDAVPEAI